MIVGTGNVGASIAFAMLNQRTAVKEIVLTDINTADAEGEAMDLQDALAVAPSYIKIHAGTYDEAKNCAICIITAGANQKPGETRTDLVQKNAKILQTIIGPVMASGFDGIFLVVSNPVDTLSFLTWNYSHLPSERVIGTGTVLDSARLRLKLSEKLGVNPKSIHAYQVGEHGDTELTLWSSACIGGESLADMLPQHERDNVEKFVRDKAYSIIDKKGATHYGVATCVVHIVNCILNDERRIMPVSSLDDNTGVYNGFPAIIGRQGVIRRLETRMSESEAIKFQQSVNAIKNTLKEVRDA